MAGADLVPDGVEVGAVRISVTGWEGWVLEGLQVSLSSRFILHWCSQLPPKAGLGGACS